MAGWLRALRGTQGNSEELVTAPRSGCAPTPAVVLALGRLGVEVAADVQSIFLHSDERHAAVTCFLALADGAEGPRFVPLEDAPSAGMDGSQTRWEASQRCVAGTARLRATLEAALRDLRTHERLIAAGLGDVLAPPLDLIIVADLTRPGAAGALIPLVLLLQDLLAHEPYGMGHLLLSTAFADEEISAAQVYVALRELDALADPAQMVLGQPLAEALGLEAVTPLSFRIYLFDHRKDGMREVKDRAELRVILGNFLLALLSGRLAQRTADDIPRPEMLERRAFYSAAAATALIFQPEPLIEACAARLGADFIAAEMGPEAVPDPRLADELAAKLEATLGDLRSWLERLCIDTPCEVRATAKGVHLGLHFTGFRWEQVRREDWAETIDRYDALFGRMKLPRYRERMEENATTLARELLARQDAAIEALPQAARLYPGGLRTARRALQKLDERLEERIETLSVRGEGPTVPLHEKQDLEILERAAWNFPDLPAFVARLVLLCTVEAYALISLGAGLRRWLAVSLWLGWGVALLACMATVGAAFLWLQRKDARLIKLRSRCVHNVERKYAALLEETAQEQLVVLCQELRKRIAEALEKLERLQATLKETQEQLAEHWAASPQVASPFRVSAVDNTFAEWAYRRWRVPPEEMRGPLLEEHRFLAGWREVATEVLISRLLSYGRRIFAPLRTLSLEDVLRRRGDEDVAALLSALAQRTTPLLRPNFDRLGGGGHAHTGRYVLLGDPATSAFAPALNGTLSAWETVTTGDRYVALCCCTHHLIPLAALRELMRRGRRAYQGLGVEERRRIEVLGIGDQRLETGDSIQ